MHTKVLRLKDQDFKEEVPQMERNLRGLFRPFPNVMGFSLYYRPSQKHYTIVENTLYKPTWTYAEVL